MKRSIDEAPYDAAVAPPDDELHEAGWAVAVSDDYEDAEPRIQMTVEELGRAGTGLTLHLDGASVARLRAALRKAATSVGLDPGA